MGRVKKREWVKAEQKGRANATPSGFGQLGQLTEHAQAHLDDMMAPPLVVLGIHKIGKL